MRPIWIAAAALAALSACSPPAAQDKSGEAPGAVAAASADATGSERFFGREAFTIVMNHTGRQTGTSTTHVREWGRKRAEVNDTSISVASITQATRNRVIYEGARVITVDTATNAATAVTNPLYDEVVSAMRGRGGVEFGQEIMTRMGGRKTDETGSFAGHDCEYWEIAQLGSRSCVTPWGATLHLRSSIGGITIEQTAAEVRLGDGGPDAAFAYDASKVTEGPDIGALMNRMKSQ